MISWLLGALIILLTLTTVFYSGILFAKLVEQTFQLMKTRWENRGTI